MTFRRKSRLLAIYFMLVSCMADSSALKMETRSPKRRLTSGELYRSTRMSQNTGFFIITAEGT